MSLSICMYIVLSTILIDIDSYSQFDTCFCYILQGILRLQVTLNSFRVKFDIISRPNNNCHFSPTLTHPLRINNNNFNTRYTIIYML